MLAGARLGDDSALPEPPREQGLAERVVELVRAGVEQVLALQVEALSGREAFGKRQRRGAAAVGAPERLQLVPERRMGERLAPAGPELVEGRDQGLGNVAPAVLAVGAADRGYRAASTNACTRS